jgi:hypothetical protein
MLVVCGKVKMILEHAKHCPSQNCRDLSKPNLASIKDDLSVPENMVLVIPWGKILKNIGLEEWSFFSGEKSSGMYFE